jgi:hypothetical protein
VNALASDDVGEYLNRHCVASFLKVGTFNIVNGAKQGGNVASYFCTSDGSVLHAVAGPVSADVLLREARWVVDAYKLAGFEARGNAEKTKDVFRRAHAERLLAEHGVDRRPSRYQIVPPKQYQQQQSNPNARVSIMASRVRNQHLGNQGKIHYLLTDSPLVKVEDFYKVVFEEILNEKVSTLPVAVR